MTASVLLCLGGLFSTYACLAVSPVAGLTPEQSARDVKILKRTLLEMHPALTKYRSQTDTGAAFKRFEDGGKSARNAA